VINRLQAKIDNKENFHSWQEKVAACAKECPFAVFPSLSSHSRRYSKPGIGGQQKY
jgi:hypothetical protein